MSETYKLGTAMPKRIYSDVPLRAFEQFRQRAKAEGLTIAEAMNAIALAYASGDFYILTHEHKSKPVNEYLRAHKQEGVSA